MPCSRSMTRPISAWMVSMTPASRAVFSTCSFSPPGVRQFSLIFWSSAASVRVAMSASAWNTEVV